LSIFKENFLHNNDTEDDRVIKITKELKNAEQELIDQFYTDYLSSLPNLYKLRDDLEENDDCTLIILNINNFKILNDFYGFVIGDFILESVARKIKNSLKQIQAYRVMGDEFAILLNEKLSLYSLKTFLYELTNTLSHMKFLYADTEIYIDLTFASSASTKMDNIFSKVNMALKYAKEEKLNFWIYEDSMESVKAHENNLKYATKIRNAIKSSGVVPYFQPIIDNKTNKIVKFESLARLIDDKGIIHAPDNFIPISKTIKVYDLVTKTIISKTFALFEDDTFEFSINLSFEDINNQEIYNFILDKLISSNMGKRVTFELLESEKVTDFQKVLRFFSEVKKHGGKIAIDNFGSGFSNFSYMTQMKPDYIKIDGSLIRNLDTDINAQIIVETIVDFAKKLNIKTVAEYVHSSTVLSAVKNIKIDYSQGFYIDKPRAEINVNS